MLELDHFVDKRRFVPAANPGFVSDADLETFNRDGYCVVRDAIPSELVERMVAAAHERFDAANNRHWISAPERLDPRFEEFFLCDPIGRIIRDLNGPSEMFLGFLLRKPAHDPHVKPWHQDGVYWGGSMQQVCALFTALTPFTRDNGALYAIPGSHRLGRLHHWIEDDILLVCDTAGLAEPVCVVAEPGDIVAMHSLTVHGSDENRSAQSRLNLGSHWASKHFELQLDASTIDLNARLAPKRPIEHD